MNEQQETLIYTVMDMINGALTTMEADPYFAPPKWILENWWATLNGVIQITSSSSTDDEQDA